jgi:SAM-dependent methyltransferase
MNVLLPILLILGQSGYQGSPLPAIHHALIAAEVSSKDVVYDIGSGDGRVCILAAKQYNCKAIGIELDENLVNISRLTILKNGVRGRVKIRHEDALKANLSDATVVFLYHQTNFLKMLRPQLEKLAVGTRVICLDYPPPWMDLQPVKTVKVGEHTHKIYMWKCEAKEKDTVLISTAKHYPGIQFFKGERNDLLVKLAQDCANLLASRGVYKFWPPGRGGPRDGDGHPNWDSRYRQIKSQLQMTGCEVTAMSWPDTSNIFTPRIANELFYDWERSPGHWRVISTSHKMYGEAFARTQAGIWFGAIIVAD